MLTAIDYEQSGTVFNIQKFSVHDGPGIRTIVFLKGCPLSCKWCSNPESQSSHPVVMLNEKNCIACKKCITVCKRNAIDYTLKGYINREKCVNCGQCAQACYAKARVVSGRIMNVTEVMQELKKDAIHYRRSKGGITLSGGEPLVQPAFSSEILKASKNQGWHTAIETTGYAPAENLIKVIPHVDLVLLDIKQIDSVIHQRDTGMANELILKNALKIAEMARQVIVRVPVIPGFNADERSIRLICEFAKYLKGVEEIHLLPYHKLGANKYEALGRPFTMEQSLKVGQEEMGKYKVIAEKQGFHCLIGGA